MESELKRFNSNIIFKPMFLRFYGKKANVLFETKLRPLQPND
ncbi:hypothetical protein LEP1GSC172_1049 [Leptospira noguchii]|uniref:Uncharacterized protein n=2 Tax=Leptospira noguchii TaxID=28182 RepID=T0GV52_9LEPT|nr:hypothetical protein LEP1GSC172_1049 [Leptospira noguchii]EQA72812.1 hypothetical protein LEP1GSC059_3366 [Leptospira noguchii serovar Panama str. CZ214]